MTTIRDEASETAAAAHRPGTTSAMAASRPARGGSGLSVADHLAPLFSTLFTSGTPPVTFKFWDGSELGPQARRATEPAGTGSLEPTRGTVTINSVDALKRFLWSPNELGPARAFVAGEIDIDGDVPQVLRCLRDAGPDTIRLGLRSIPLALKAVAAVGGLGLQPALPPEETHLSIWRNSLRHSARRDAAAVTHHYDVGNDFYRLVLGPSMTYSCARFDDSTTTLEQAQASKHDLVCKKLGLHDRPVARLLDVGCGWGAMAIHAAANYGVNVVGITLSAPQAELARQKVAEAGLAANIEIRLQDYRKLGGETFDAISSIGMFEHVGEKRMAQYFETLHGLLTPEGRLLNHAISSPGGSKLGNRTFFNRYVFPDGELLDVADVAGAMEGAGFEVRDVESLREHYATTLRHWISNLETDWPRAVASVGEARARVWRLYMAGSVNGFTDGGINVHQVLGVVPATDGRSGMPRTRLGWS
jgi:cyclopropane-fatty-acyl-phospholipid synthase